MELNTVSTKLTNSALMMGLWLLSLSSCQHKHPESSFPSERHYRHALFKGGFETILFKADGSIFVKMLVNGVAVIANGKYERNRLITVKLPTGPMRCMIFVEITDEKLLSFDTDHRWERI
jgi:hypothetical protein